ncbi:PHB depolymerase family esterase [Algiphilus sp.]|uniref:alpha/beta hydrolase family esterase n=1 Tax=Algiphilus sp. TaxID=1872431 RepID=UPI0032EC1532
MVFSSAPCRIGWLVPALLLALLGCSGDDRRSEAAGGGSGGTPSLREADAESGNPQAAPDQPEGNGQDEAPTPPAVGDGDDGEGAPSGDGADTTTPEAEEGPEGTVGEAPGGDADVTTEDASDASHADPRPASMITERRQWNGRPYLVYRPSPVRRNAPVVLLLHAATEDMHSVLDARRPSAVWKAIAQDEAIILVAPNGTNADGERDDEAAYWNDCADNSRQTRLNSSADDLGFLVALMDRVVAEYQADPMQVYVYGLSNGGSMALRLAQEAPSRVAGVVSVLGLAAEEGECVTPATPTPVMLMHGTDDPVASYSDGSGIIRDYLLGAEESYRHWLAINDVASEPERRVDFADRDRADGSTVHCRQRGSGQRRVQLCAMEGAGHLDPSLRYAYGSASRSFGSQNRDIESAEVAWAFLRDASAAVTRRPDAAD